MLKSLLTIVTALGFCNAQYFPPEPEGLTELKSKFNNDVKISYKANSICDPSVKSFAGYISLPPHTLASLGVTNQTWPINTFFWYFESKKDPKNAPLVIQVAGGPAVSASGLPLSDHSGPCKVNSDANSTRPWEWSWISDVNLLFVDQPVQVGLSYDTLQNVSYNVVSGELVLLNAKDPLPVQNNTLQVGTWASVDIDKTSPGSVQGAYPYWHFLQVWLQEFPEFKSDNKKISMTGGGYSGKYTTAMFEFFQQQNDKIRAGTWKEEGRQYILELDTLIFENGIMDLVGSWFSYPEFSIKNPYGVVGYNNSVYENTKHELNKPGGCLDQAYTCGNLSLEYDPLAIGVNESVNAICRDAAKFCDEKVQYPFALESGRSFSDITVPGSFRREPPFWQAYLQRPHVQQALGMRLNWTLISDWIFTNNRREGDFARPGWPGKMAYLLEKGVKITFIYGDKDYICNWVGGEAVSLAINYTHTKEFHAAGYENIVTNDSYIGGQVRQYGNLSFARIFQAARPAGGLQPETVYRVVNRAIFNKDIATGEKSATAIDGTPYSSKGASETSSYMLSAPSVADILQVCYLADLGTCTEDQIAAILNGTALIKDYIYVDANSTKRYPEIVGPGPALGARDWKPEGGWEKRGIPGRSWLDQNYYI